MQKLAAVMAITMLVGIGSVVSPVSEAVAKMTRHGNFHGKYAAALNTPKKVPLHCRKHYSHRLHKTIRTCGPSTVHKVAHHKKPSTATY